MSYKPLIAALVIVLSTLTQNRTAFAYYDPALGRFLSRDPMRYVDGPNLYAYVSNRPADFADPSGLTVTIEAGDLDKYYIEVQRALQGIIGNCAKLWVDTSSHEKWDWGLGRGKNAYGMPTINITIDKVRVTDRGTLKYSDEDPSCKCSDCWKLLKQALDSDTNIPIKTGGDDDRTHADDGLPPDAPRTTWPDGDFRPDKPEVRVPPPPIHPGYGPIVIDPTTGQPVREPPSLDLVLFHELIGHALTGNLDEGKAIDAENLARNCLNKLGAHHPQRDRNRH